MRPENAEYAETASLANIKTVLCIVVVLAVETAFTWAAACTTTGTETLVETVVPLTVARTVATGAAPVLTAVLPTDSEATTWLLADKVWDEDTAAPFTAEKAAARSTNWARKLDSI